MFAEDSVGNKSSDFYRPSSVSSFVYITVCNFVWKEINSFIHSSRQNFIFVRFAWTK